MIRMVTSVYSFARSRSILPTVCQTFCATVSGKQYRENENEYFHRVLENLPSYRNTVIPRPSKSANSAARFRGTLNDSYVHHFCEVSVRTDERTSNIESPEHAELIQQLVNHLPRVSNDGLRDIAYHLCLWPATAATTTPHFKLLWNALDSECAQRCPGWSKDRQLLIADCFYHLRLSRISRYNRTMLRCVSRVVSRLSVQDVVQLLYYSNLQRWMVSAAKPVMEAKLSSEFCTLTIGELGSVCQSYFKCQQRIELKELLHQLANVLVQSLPRVDSFVVCAIVKQLRYSASAKEAVPWKIVLEACEPHISRWDAPTAIQLVMLATHVKSYHPRLLDAVARHLVTKLNAIRLKEVAKLLLTLTMFSHEIENESQFYDTIKSDLRSPSRKREIEMYHQSFVTCVWCLAMAGMYSADLIAAALSEDMVRNSVKHQDISYHATALQYSVRIESPTYDGPFLGQQVLDSLYSTRHLTTRCPDWTMQDLSLQEKIILQTLDCLQTKYGSAPVIRQLLPHFHYPDIVFGVQIANTDITLLQLELCSEDGVLVPQSSSGAVPCAVVVHGLGAFSEGSQHLMGLAKVKVRQLRTLGFRVVELSHFELSCMSSDFYIQDKLLAACTTSLPKL
ncbi:FAST kinase domain-containing protein 3, mitochondrial [Ixodes scapularis]